MAKGLNRAEVLENVEKLMKESEEYKAGAKYLGYKAFPMAQVYAQLSIFDWWVKELSYSRLKEMRSFLRVAGELGYDGYVCFKVGATGCANGMWAHKKESETGYSPDGECLYRSFTPDYVTWDAELPDGRWLHKIKEEKDGKWTMTLDELRRMLKEEQNG